MIPRSTWHGQRFTLRWCDETSHWTLRRGEYRVASSVDWDQLYELCLRITNRERAAARREAFLHGRPASD